MSTDKERVPKAMQDKYDEITEITDAFCQEHFDEEYAGVCRALTAKLSRKRPSPLARGRTKTWAAAVIYTIGQVNFLFDKNQPPYMAAGDLCEAVGVSQSTASSKAKKIRDMLNIGIMDPEWTLPSMMDGNPMVWMLSVNGMIVDIRTMPREIQEEAYRKGLIPYIPE